MNNISLHTYTCIHTCTSVGTGDFIVVPIFGEGGGVAQACPNHWLNFAKMVKVAAQIFKYFTIRT